MTSQHGKWSKCGHVYMSSELKSSKVGPESGNLSFYPLAGGKIIKSGFVKS